MDDMDTTTPLKFLADFQAREALGDYCVLCGMRYTDEDYKHAIFVGEGVNGRSVHGSCWAGFRNLCSRLDLDWQSAVNRKRAEREASTANW